MKPPIALIVYLVGLAPLGLFYEQLKDATGGEWMFLVSVVLYLLALRYVGARFSRRVERDQDPNE